MKTTYKTKIFWKINLTKLAIYFLVSTPFPYENSITYYFLENKSSNKLKWHYRVDKTMLISLFSGEWTNM